MSFSWIPIYEELATKLLDYEDRQRELVDFLSELREEGLRVVSVNDQGTTGPTQLTEIDPFTFFASFNRRIRDSDRIATLSRIREHFDLESQVPTDFDGIPTVDNQSSWFMPYAKMRKADDVPSLWRLARQAVEGGRAATKAESFDRCLKIRSVKSGKLSSGLFWLRPRAFLPVDSRSMTYLRDHHVEVPPKIESWAQYIAVLDATVQALGDNFPALSHAAWKHGVAAEEVDSATTHRFWAGGHGEKERLQQFLSTRTWSIGWPKDAPSQAAIAAWSRIAEIQPGDQFAIKGYGGRNDLKVHAVGTVVKVDPDGGTLEWETLDVPHFQGKAPGPAGAGSWQETLCEVTTPLARQALFGIGAPEEDVQSAPSQFARPPYPLNLILHGPPGTGKTYQMRQMKAHFPLPEPEAQKPWPEVSELTWFQVVALALHDLGKPSAVLEIAAHPLVQAKYVERAPQTKLNAFVWQQLQSHTVRESTTVRYTLRVDPLVFDRDDSGKWFLAAGLPPELAATETSAEAAPPTNQFFVTFHPSFSYEDFVEGIRPESDLEGAQAVRYPLRAGVFKQACERAVQLAGYTGGLAALCDLPAEERRDIFEGARPAVIFIDEINRGNVARIFGELITLIERDKRLGEDQELIVTLPGSQQRFGVPPNLWIVGTMNTADRSVVAVDIALRRRFAFEECAPEPELLSAVVIGDDEEDGASVEVAKLLTTINTRLEALRDRDHRIGHSFFWPMVKTPALRTLEELRRVFEDHIIPLLVEYFHDDLGRVGLVLGEQFVERRKGKVAFASFDHPQREDLAERTIWELKPIDAIGLDGFRAIYA